MVEPRHASTKTRTLRNAHGLSVEQLVQRAGCKPELIEELEQGKLAPRSKIARALGVRLGTLLDDEEVAGAVVARLESSSELE